MRAGADYIARDFVLASMYDRSLAALAAGAYRDSIHALELIGRHLKLWDADAGQNVSVGIMQAFVAMLRELPDTALDAIEPPAEGQ